VESTRKPMVAPRGRFLVAMRPEPATAENAQEMARLLGMKPELVRDVLGGSLPRVIASRSTLHEAESLARVLTARGRESIVWDRELPGVSLFQAERLTLEGGQFVFEQRSRARRLIPARDVQRIVDLRLRSESHGAGKAALFGGKADSADTGQQFPDRALLIVPESGLGDPGVLSTRTVDTGKVLFPGLSAAKLLQEAVMKARALVPDRVLEVRTSPAVLGYQEDEGDPLEWVLQLFARLPPRPVTG
jgi:hypothetical protein